MSKQGKDNDSVLKKWLLYLSFDNSMFQSTDTKRCYKHSQQGLLVKEQHIDLR